MQAQNTKNNDVTAECDAKYMALRTLGTRAAFLFINFFLIILAYYQLKPASRSHFNESLGAQRLPYIWIATAVTMVVFMTYYNRMVERHSLMVRQVAEGRTGVVGRHVPAS